jgi:tetratricopeptide (TPR) repeat protein
MPRASAGPGTTSRLPHPAEGEDAGHAQRLNGWKEIAAYLGRGERTVKRWEAERDLPVQRVPGGRRAAVHAYRNELETWLQSNRLPAPDDIPAEAVPVLSPGDASQGNIEAPVPALVAPSRALQPWSWIATAAAVTGLAAALLFVGWNHHEHKEKNPASVSPSDRALAHDLYLKGRFEWNQRTPESLNRALDDFTQSIVHDPTSAPTYSGMADTYLLMHEYSLMPEHEAYSRGRAAAAKAVALDDSLSEAHRSLAFVDAWGNWDFVSAEWEIRRAIELNPRDPVAHLWFATMFETREWYPVAEREFNRAQELDPSSPVILANKSIWLFDNGKTDAGLELARQVEHGQPDFVAPHRYLSLMAWEMRDYPSFLDETGEMATLKHDTVLTQIVKAARLGYEQAGEKGLLRKLYAAQKQFYDSGQLSGEAVALTCIRLGDRDQALRLLQDDYTHRRADFLAILDIPDFVDMQTDPRVRTLVDQLHFPAPPSPSQAP